MHSRFVYAPDLVAPAHLFGVHVRSMTPDPPTRLLNCPLKQMMHSKSSYTEALLDAADAHAAAAYKAGM